MPVFVVTMLTPCRAGFSSVLVAVNFNWFFTRPGCEGWFRPGIMIGPLFVEAGLLRGCSPLFGHLPGVPDGGAPIPGVSSLVTFLANLTTGPACGFDHVYGGS